MKKILYSSYIMLAVFIMALSGCTEDADKISDTMKDKNLGGVIPYATFYTPKIFDVADLLKVLPNHQFQISNLKFLLLPHLLS